MKTMWNTYRRKAAEIGEAWKCPTCGLMITAGHICRVRETVQCPDCKAMLEAGLEAKHHCSAKVARETAEREKQKKENRRIAAAKAAEKRAKGLVPRVKMVKPKEEMVFMEVVDVYGDGSGRYEEVTVTKNPWKCRICGNVWQTEHEARSCAFEQKMLRRDGGTYPKAPHAKSYFRLYGVRYYENGVPRGNYLREVEFNVMRVEEAEKLPEGKKWDMEDIVDEQKAEEIFDAEAKRVQKQTKGALVYGNNEPYEDAYNRYVKEATKDEDPEDTWAGSNKEFD